MPISQTTQLIYLFFEITEKKINLHFNISMREQELEYTITHSTWSIIRVNWQETFGCVEGGMNRKVQHLLHHNFSISTL